MAAVQATGMYAEAEPDRGPQWFSTWFHDGTPRPSQDFIQSCVERTRQAAAGTAFKVTEPGVWCSNAATRKLPYNRHTGEFLGSFVDIEMPANLLHELLGDLARAYGIDPADIELRDPPEFTVAST